MSSNLIKMQGKGDCEMKPPENPAACLSVEKFRKLVRVHLDAVSYIGYFNLPIGLA